MGQPVMEDMAFRRRHHLRDARQAAEGRGIENTVSITLGSISLVGRIARLVQPRVAVARHRDPQDAEDTEAVRRSEALSRQSGVSAMLWRAMRSQVAARITSSRRPF